MSDKELKIFELCSELHKLLGDKEAIADLKKLYNNHPEMFKDIKELSNVIQEVISEPEMIIKNPRPKSKKDFIAIKHLKDDENKIGDIGIRNDERTNIVFHANVSASRNFKRLAKKEIVVAGEAVHSLHTSRPAELGGNNQRLSGANAHSATIKETIPHQTKESQVQNTLETQINKIQTMQESISFMPRAKDLSKDFEKDLEESFNVKLDKNVPQNKNNFNQSSSENSHTNFNFILRKKR